MDFWISFANFFAAAIRLTAPIALGTLACTISERAGVINIGIEGSMLFSGFLAAVGSYYTGSPWVGLRCGCAAGAFLARIGQAAQQQTCILYRSFMISGFIYANTPISNYLISEDAV